MAGRIPQSFIDELVSRADIVEVIDSHVPLKKAGREYKACCPFHDEKTPSFTVSTEKQFYHCFGCGAHGTVIGFLMNYRQLEFVEAVESLAQRLGLEVPREGGEAAAPAGPPTEPLYEVLERASRFFQRQLRVHPEKSRAVDYLKSRGLSGEIAAEFMLGFAPPGWDNLIEALGGTAEELKLLARAGLVIQRSDPSYDRFRDRVMFPIVDRRGRTIGFGGRVLADDTPKYLNSPEGPVFHKGRELYGAHQAMRSAGNLERIHVVEGYMDAVALAQAGIRNVVATLGTAATPDHVERLFRLAPDVVYCFDGDDAGRRAAWRALEITLPRLRDGRQAFFMFLPEGEDPDTLVRSSGRKAFEEMSQSAVSLGTFLFDRLSARVDLNTIDGRSRLIEMARPLLGKIPEGAFRKLAQKKLADMTGMDPDDSAILIKGPQAPRPKRQSAATVRAALSSQTPVRRAIKMLIQHPELASDVSDASALKDIDLPGAPLLLELVELLRENPDFGTAEVLERYRDNEAGVHLGKLAAEELSPLGDGIRIEFDDAIRAVARRAEETRLEARRDALQALIKAGEASEEQKQSYREIIARLGRPSESA
ncbi:MAG TPA: DNA primase [Gammaproteobacteria bacterium]|nr:DNA primase [Gammaproteobacteria bacterium]